MKTFLLALATTVLIGPSAGQAQSICNDSRVPLAAYEWLCKSPSPTLDELALRRRYELNRIAIRCGRDAQCWSNSNLHAAGWCRNSLNLPALPVYIANQLPGKMIAGQPVDITWSDAHPFPAFSFSGTWAVKSGSNYQRVTYRCTFDPVTSKVMESTLND